MRMSEAEFLNRLNKAFPEKVIFAEQARLSVYLSLFVEIRRYARGTGVSSVQWLTDRGFIWKETGYVEPDMHNVDKCGPSPDYTAFELADYVFRAYPLAGEYQLTDAEDALLYQSASETVKKVLIDGGRTSVREDAVLVLETINLLKGWSSELADEETSGSLWNYIFLQYGFNPENSEAAANRLYNYFRGAIKGTLAHYKRFFAPEGTQRYYTSLLLHALAPKQSISAASRSNAWVAILNEMFNARRGTSLVSMGVLSFAYRRNAQVATAFQGDPYNLSSQDAIALLELLTQDAVFSGAIDAGKEYTLTAAEREYIFFTPSAKKLALLRTGDSAKQSWISGWRGRKRPNGNYYPNSRLVRLTRALGISDDEADAILEDYWTNVFKAETEEFVLDANDFDICIGGTEGAKFYRCKKCGRVTPYNVKKHCASVKCAGMLEPCDPLKDSAMNHYARLYSSSHSEPLYIKEHTAQLAKDQQTRYQEAFVQKKINALSCSTTFEMGVDVGSLETVYMRDVPPSPSNYVQRAGRAGRAKHSAAFVMTYAKLSSHDFTYYDDPTAMISGKIKAPIFEIENEKILNRHIFAVALSSFFAQHKEVYAGDNQTVLLNEGGYDLLKEYLNTQPENLRQLLLRSIPTKMHQRLGIADFGWINRLCGENGVLEIAVQDFRGTVAEMEKELLACRRRHDDEAAGVWSRTLRNFRCSKDDNAGKKSLIGFLVRNNVLPKYGFPVDTVELIPDINAVGRGKALQLARDLQMAIAEYAPGAEVVADGKMYVSRYIRKMPGKNADAAWEKGFYCPKCPTCGQPNFTKDPVAGSGRECVSCHTPIKRLSWRKTLEPRMGFCAEKEARPVPMHRPEHDFKTDDYYIGDPHRNLIAKQIFEVNGQALQIESTSNDSLVVIGQTDYKVCPACGYASETGIPLEHKNSRGYRCVNKEGNSAEYRLSHDFKTDVAKITFVTQEAADINVMLSVLYALLEGLSREMGIERTDIKGCLFYTSVDGCMIFSVVLYDAVAGGAGHVRRIVTADGQAFQRVLAKAISVVDNCDCDSSCYRCLRNYYNQKIHDNLNRNQASAFLHQWVGNMNPLPMETIE